MRSALLTLGVGGALTGVGAAASGVPAYELLSVNSRERAADDRTYEVDVSGSGRYVVFSSEGRNLSGQDARSSEGVADVYLRDRRAGRTRLVSLATNGRTGCATGAGW